MEKLVNIYREYPKKIPLKVVAELIGINEEGIKATVQSGKCPFGLGYQLKAKGNRVTVIPTLTFLMWYTNNAILNYL